MKQLAFNPVQSLVKQPERIHPDQPDGEVHKIPNEKGHTV